MAIGAVEAIKGHGKSLDDVLVFGIDGIPSAYQSIANGEMKATLLQDAKAIAAKTVEVMQLYFETGSVESEYTSHGSLLTAKILTSTTKQVNSICWRRSLVLRLCKRGSLYESIGC